VGLGPGRRGRRSIPAFAHSREMFYERYRNNITHTGAASTTYAETSQRALKVGKGGERADGGAVTVTA
jgi:hypothetical protein